MIEDISNFKQYQRAANYLTAAQIFLQDNFLLERPLKFEDIKSRLLGHWGSGPGVNLAYAHMNRMVRKYSQEAMFVLGPGHAFPALQANLFLEGSLEEFYPKANHTYDGIGYICRQFSWPYGFPSHSNPGTPGVILEGGELGYSLSVSYGAALDNKNLIIACLVGDGEAETGPAAASWHLNKLVNPKTNGTVLPILHLNGYKISAPTVFGRMSDDELKSLFWGYGYEPHLISGDNLHQQMAEAMDWAHESIWDIKNAPEVRTAPHLPMIIMRTPKGMSGVKELDGNKIEGNCLSHQVVLTEAKTNPEQLQLLEDWLKSYNFNELFSREAGFGEFRKTICPTGDARMGMSRHAYGGNKVYKPLKLPDITQFTESADKPGTIGSSSMIRCGLYLEEAFKFNANESNLRLMSPDETYSNKLNAIFSQTARGWMWPIEEWDKDLSPDGRVMEMLSEHNLQGLTQGYVLTGRHAIFASYEAFIQVVSSMMDQYAKFLKHLDQFEWRGEFPSINYILTSSGWRQDHNGFSHQNPGFIDDVLRRQGDFANVFFPPDGNSALATIDKMLKSTKGINVMVAGKTLEPRWLTPDLAIKQMAEAIMTWQFASDSNPDVVMVGCGDYTTKEIMAAINIVKDEYPEARLRCVNVSSLNSSRHGHGIGYSGNHVSDQDFNNHMTSDKPVICAFHGYPETFKSILFDYGVDIDRFDVRGYIEHGSTTTPFDMHVRNLTSRYHLAIAVFEKLQAADRIPRETAQEIITKYNHKLKENTEYIKVQGVDMPEIEDWQWNLS